MVTAIVPGGPALVYSRSWSNSGYDSGSGSLSLRLEARVTDPDRGSEYDASAAVVASAVPDSEFYPD